MSSERILKVMDKRVFYLSLIILFFLLILGAQLLTLISIPYLVKL